MKRLIYIIAVLLSSTVAAQQPPGIGIVHKQEKYYLTKTCYDLIRWDEVALPNQKIQQRINTVIRKAVRSFKETDASLLCNKEMNYSATRSFKIVYARQGIISYHLASDIYYKGILHDFHSFHTLNFNIETGAQITLDSIIDYTSYSKLYNLVITKIAAKTEIDGVDSLYLKSELEHQHFLVTNNGIKLLYLVQNYPIDVTLPFKELIPYANKNGLLRRLADARGHTK